VAHLQMGQALDAWSPARGTSRRIRTFDLLIQRTPNVIANGRCDLSVARTRILSFRRAIRLNMPDGVR
jgi:hypothetical protein